MAARIRKLETTAEWRKKIQVSMILNRLQNHLVGDVEMSRTQIKAAEILLRKSMPDLSASELTGADGGAVEFIAKWQSAKS